MGDDAFPLNRSTSFCDDAPLLNRPPPLCDDVELLDNQILDELKRDYLALDCLKLDTELLAATLGEDFSFEGMTFRAKVVSVYDGDTVRVKFKFNGHMMQYCARLAGYDSPEMHPRRSSKTYAAEKIAAAISRNALIRKIGDQLITIGCDDFDKYGRLLITAITDDGVNLNEWMVAQNYGIAYHGGHKAAFKPAT
jgi:endonuclease YncB( thermonuclease family)